MLTVVDRRRLDLPGGGRPSCACAVGSDGYCTKLVCCYNLYVEVLGNLHDMKSQVSSI